MILSNLRVAGRANQNWQFSGLDSFDRCSDKKHFESFPHAVNYNYNSRGFRDQEWPSTIEELRDAVWCVGDSFTVGLGSSLAHTWPVRLAAKTNRRVINVSMDGASNEWISRHAENILLEIAPTNMVIMWSYTSRRELNDNLLSDEDRRLPHDADLRSNLEIGDWQDWLNFVDCKKRIDKISDSIVQFSIPGFHPDIPQPQNMWSNICGPHWPKSVPDTLEELNALPAWIVAEIKNLHHCWDSLSAEIQLSARYKYIINSQNQHSVMLVEQNDLARDGHHFDLITADQVATQACERLNFLTNSKN